jgi:enoyl-CoA hydratase/carnithine racemase
MSDAHLTPQHFLWRIENGGGVVTLDRPERKNPLTFDSYAELCDLFRGLHAPNEVKAVVITGAGTLGHRPSRTCRRSCTRAALG